MPATKKTADTDQIERIREQVEEIDDWAASRVLAYRSQRDLWQRVTYILLGVSAATAIGAAISAGLKAQLSTVIFAGVSAGLSVITASLKTPTQVTKAEAARATVGALRAKIDDFQTDMPDLSSQDRKRQLEQIRKDYREASKLPSPSERRLNIVAAAWERMTAFQRNIHARQTRWLSSSSFLLQQASEHFMRFFPRLLNLSAADETGYKPES
jgi:TolA-binding protein